MTGEPVTTNPLLIMLINMTIVFVILWLIGMMIRLIHFVDPTKKKPVREAFSAPMKPATQTVPRVNEDVDLKERELVAVITTAIMAYGYRDVRIASIKKIEEK